MSRAWMMLIVAGLLETGWAIGLKYTEGFTRLVPSFFVVVALAGSMFLLARSVQEIPIGTAYGVWVGIGALGAAVAGVVLLGEPLTVWRAVFLVMMLVAIVGLKITSVG